MESKNKRLTREEIAERDIGKTDISLINQRVLLIFFFFLISFVSLIQISHNILKDKQIVNSSDDRFWSKGNDSLSRIQKLLNLNNHLLLSKDNYESSIEEQSLYRKKMIPITQMGLLSLFNTGNENGFIIVSGNENAWIDKDNFYYKVSNLYLTSPGFLDKKQIKKRKLEENVQANPLMAIIDFNKQLKKRKIKLIVIPTPPKASLLLKNADNGHLLNNESYNQFVHELKKEGVIVYNLFETLRELNLENAGFLKYDTHWTPNAISFVSEEICRLLDSLSIEKGHSNYTLNKVIAQNHGDIADMLRLNRIERLYQPQKVEIKQVTEGNYLFKASKQSDILFLGDSYSNIYSLKKMGWGESAGLTEHVSVGMQKPIDRILMNDAGAYATRQELANEMKRGRDRLGGKKVVIWQFAARELSIGDWKLLDLELNKNYTSNFYTPEFEVSDAVTGIVREVSSVPIPGTVPYKDHIMSVHISDLKNINSNAALGQSVVYFLSMEDNVWTEAARLRSGDEIKLKLYNWDSYSEKFGSINRSEIPDDDLSLEIPCWGELIQQ